MSTASTQRIRIVCISDTHNASPKHGAFELPSGDILIHAGDLTNQGTYAELAEVVDWMAEAGESYQAKLVIAGNHDLTLDREYYDKTGYKINHRNPQNADECIALMQETASQRGVTYLQHASHDITLKFTVEDGTSRRSSIKVFGSPWIPSCGPWAFSYEAPDARTDEQTAEVEHLWSRIPSDTDILITHTPAKGHCDHNHSGLAGCDMLARRVKHVRPLLHISGHVHAGRGYERVEWDETDENGETRVIRDTLAGKAGDGKTQGLIDLTGRRKDKNGLIGRKIDNDLRDRRKETCFVNPAINAGNSGGRRWNAPVVIEVDIPLD
ncbi:hypothetical protein KEM54_006808 [Ascosphaera aggregata]|nr:hypothetical protein KEM54_006808 [Ascosphaera aggregata]